MEFLTGLVIGMTGTHVFYVWHLHHWKIGFAKGFAESREERDRNQS